MVSGLHACDRAEALIICDRLKLGETRPSGRNWVPSSRWGPSLQSIRSSFFFREAISYHYDSDRYNIIINRFVEMPWKCQEAAFSFVFPSLVSGLQHRSIPSASCGSPPPPAEDVRHRLKRCTSKSI